MNDQRSEEIKKRMNEKTTEELLQIWVTNNHYEWSDDAFIAIKQILSERNALIPTQNAQPADPKRKKSGRGFRTWAIVLLIIGLFGQGKIVCVLLATEPLLASCIAAGLLLGPAIALMWYRIALIKPLATGFRYAFGCILHGIGTLHMLMFSPIIIPLYQFARESGRTPPTSKLVLLSFLGLLVQAAIFLLPAFLLCFKRPSKRM